MKGNPIHRQTISVNISPQSTHTCPRGNEKVRGNQYQPPHQYQRTASPPSPCEHGVRWWTEHREPRNAHTGQGLEMPYILVQWHRSWKANLGYKVSWTLDWAKRTLLSKRAGGSYGLADGWGKGTSAKPHLITSSVKREPTPESCPVASVALETTGTHRDTQCNNKFLSYVTQQYNPSLFIQEQ